MYGLLAKTVDVSEDGNVFTFHLRPEARFHDGSPLTAEDVAFSFTLLKKDGHPNLSQVIREMVGAEAADPATVVDPIGKQARDTILTVAGLRLSPKAPHRQPNSSPGRRPPHSARGPRGRTAERRALHRVRARRRLLGQGLPVNAGFGNFDVIRVDSLPSSRRRSRPSRRARSPSARRALDHLGSRDSPPSRPSPPGRWSRRCSAEKRPRSWLVHQHAARQVP